MDLKTRDPHLPDETGNDVKQSISYLYQNEGITVGEQSNVLHLLLV